LGIAGAEFETAGAAGVQEVQASSQQLPLQLSLHGCPEPVLLSSMDMIESAALLSCCICAQCESTSTAVVIGRAHVARNGDTASASESRIINSLCVRLLISTQVSPVMAS
jgi:hypothetical protein